MVLAKPPLKSFIRREIAVDNVIPIDRSFAVEVPAFEMPRQLGVRFPKLIFYRIDGSLCLDAPSQTDAPSGLTELIVRPEYFEVRVLAPQVDGLAGIIDRFKFREPLVACSKLMSDKI